MKAVSLENYHIGGLAGRDAHGERYIANGKRVTREEYDAIKRAAVRQDCFSNSSKAGVMHFYSVAYLEK